MRRESSVERAIRFFVYAQGGACIKQDANVYKGIPDRLILCPNGKHFFVEIKDEKGKASELQEHWLKKLNDMGHKAYLVNSVEKFKTVWGLVNETL
jgi:Holliday junction resolvase